MESRAEPSVSNSPPASSATLVASIDNKIVRSGPSPASWVNDLAPIAPPDWRFDHAGHLTDRAAFGATPEEVARLAAMTPEQAVASLLDYGSIPNDHLPPFDPSGVWAPSLRDFPPSRVAATERA